MDWPPAPLPGNGTQDERPFVKCSGCRRLLKCYRGPLLRTVTNEQGTWETYVWLCSACMAETVGAALRQEPPPEAA